MLLDVHRTTGKKINITEFQKVDSFVYVLFSYIYTHMLFFKLFSMICYYNILTIVPCATQ